jgi:spore germination cell wall hydrolase CwlJ-like protein
MSFPPQRAHRRNLVMGAILLLCLLGMLGIATAIYASVSRTTPKDWFDTMSGKPVASAPIGKAPESFRFKPDITAETAEELNAAVPDSTEPIISALPFAIANGATRMNAIDCLTSAVYYEAASESDAGQRAVAQVVLNRVKHPAFPNSVCGVVYQGSERRTGCQFSFTCDGALARRPSVGGWARARGVAALALSGYVEPAVGLATHYHTVWVVPYWSDNLTKIRTLGAHIFYRWNGNNGKRGAFNSAYAGYEPQPGRLAAAMLGTTSDLVDVDLSGIMAGIPAEESAVPKSTEPVPVDKGKPKEAILPIPESQLPAKGKLLVDENRPSLRSDGGRLN